MVVNISSRTECGRREDERREGRGRLKVLFRNLGIISFEVY